MTDEFDPLFFDSDYFDVAASGETEVVVEVPTAHADASGIVPMVKPYNITGSGTSGDPYILRSLADLELINTGVYTLAKHYKLGNDIDASDTARPDYNGGAGWLPIPTGLTATFDGNGKKISNLYINRPETDSVGFFAQINSSTAKVINLTLENCNITGKTYCGALVGYVTYAEIKGIDVTGRIWSYAPQSGGVIGRFYRGSYHLDDCSFSGTVVGSNDVGGIVGLWDNYNSSITIKNCTVTNSTLYAANTVGGIVGAGYNSVTTCSVSDTVVNATADHCGGLIGYNRNGVHTGNTITNVTINADNEGGLLIGHRYGGDGTIASNSVSGTVNVRYRGGLLFGVYENYNSSGTFDNTNTFQGTVNVITEQCGALAGWGAPTTITGFSVSRANVTLNTLSTTNYVGGLIGYLEAGNITNCSADIDLVGYDSVGGIVGKKYRGGNITYCSYTGTITAYSAVGSIIGFMDNYNTTAGTLDNCTAIATLNTSGPSVGGFCGYGYGTFSNLVCDENIVINNTPAQSLGGILGQGISNPCIFNNCTVEHDFVGGSNYTGGLAGYSYYGAANNCSVVGNITGINHVGGLIGKNARSGGVFQNCSYEGDVVGNDTVGGLFGSCDDEGYGTCTIMNTCTITNSTVTATAHTVGGICGYLKGIMDSFTLDETNVTVTVAPATSQYVGALVGYGYYSTITNCHLSGINISALDNVGGIVGRLRRVNTIQNCTYEGVVSGRHTVGGIVGYADNEGYATVLIDNCIPTNATVVASGENIGGIVGYFRGTLQNITITPSNVTISTTSGSNDVGGLIGESYYATVNNCIVNGINVSGQDRIGGLVGYPRRASSITNCSYTGTVSGRDAIAGGAGSMDSEGGYYPTKLENVIVNATINGKNSLGGLAGNLRGLVKDCRFTGTINSTGTTQIGGLIGYSYFGEEGTQVTSGTNVVEATIVANSATSNVGGAIGYLYRGAIVEGVIVRNTSITVGASCDNVGGLVGNAWPYSTSYTQTIRNCRVEINQVSGRDYVGGLCGVVNRTYVEKCVAINNVSGRANIGGLIGGAGGTVGYVQQSFSAGNVVGIGDYVGGLVGRYTEGVTISDAYSLSPVQGVNHIGGLVGRIEGSNIARCYSKGLVQGTGSLGGLVGSKSASQTATDCFWNTETSNQASSALGTGKTTAEMMLQATYTNFDFATPIWAMDDCLNSGYPRLVNALPFTGIYVCGVTAHATARGILFERAGSAAVEIFPETGIINLESLSHDFSGGFRTEVDPGILDLPSIDHIHEHGSLISGIAGQINLSALDHVGRFGTTVEAGVGEFILAEMVHEFVIGSILEISIGLIDLVSTETGVGVGPRIEPACGVMNLEGMIHEFVGGVTVETEIGVFSLEELIHEIGAGTRIEAGIGILTLESLEAIVVATVHEILERVSLNSSITFKYDLSSSLELAKELDVVVELSVEKDGQVELKVSRDGEVEMTKTLDGVLK